MIYLDSAATSFLKPDCVAKAVADSFQMLGNAGRGAHEPTLNASRLLYRTREKAAELFGAEDPTQVVFTANVTQSLNMVIQSLFVPGDHVITSLSEHNSVLRPLYKMEKQGVCLSFLPLDSCGRVQLKYLEGMIRPETKAIVIGHASNVTGNVVDLCEISRMTGGKNILLVVDAAQTAGALPIHMKEMGIDILCFTGHKSLLGPQGTGGIVVREGIEIEPFLVGGSGIKSFDHRHPTEMPTALEAGTANGHGIAGLEAALDYIKSLGVDEIHRVETERMRQFLEGIRDVPSVRLYGDYEAGLRAPIVTLNIGNLDAAWVSDVLWEDYGICVRAGAHCAPLIHKHFGTEEQGAVRFSFSLFNTEEDIRTAIRAIRDIAGEAENAKDQETDPAAGS